MRIIVATRNLFLPLIWSSKWCHVTLAPPQSSFIRCTCRVHFLVENLKPVPFVGRRRKVWDIPCTCRREPSFARCRNWDRWNPPRWTTLTLSSWQCSDCICLGERPPPLLAFLLERIPGVSPTCEAGGQTSARESLLRACTEECRCRYLKPLFAVRNSLHVDPLPGVWRQLEQVRRTPSSAQWECSERRPGSALTH